jgi:ornithine carbamoyltransferase
VVGEAESQVGPGELAALGGPSARRLDYLEIASQQVVDRASVSGTVKPEAFAQRLKGGGVLGGPQVEVAAKDQWRISRPLSRRLGGAQDVCCRQVRPVVGRVQVGNAKISACAEIDASKRHRPALRWAGMNRQLPPLHHPTASHQGQVRAALAGGDQVGVAAGDEGAQAAKRVARGEHPVRLGVAHLGEETGKARRALLQEGDPPLGVREQRGELGDQLAVDLHVRLVSLLNSQQSRAPGEEGRIRWEVAAVEEVPADGGEFHRRSIRCLKRDFLTGEELGAFELGKLLDRAAALKAGRAERLGADSLAGRSIALVFEKPSTRTRISFEVGVAELGANPIVLRGDEMQLSRGESAGDTARVLSRYVDAIVIRSGSHEQVAALAAGAEVPVINALTPLHHPCQALADLLTLRERRGDLAGQRLAYVGDGNNVARSLTIAGELAGVEVVVAAPSGYQLEEGHEAKLTADPRDAAAGADAIYTDVWVSMGDEEEAARRRADLAPFRVDADLLAAAKDDAIVLHCLPAHPGEEITAEVLYGDRSAVWDQAENRLHTQKALLEMLIAG